MGGLILSSVSTHVTTRALLYTSNILAVNISSSCCESAKLVVSVPGFLARWRSQVGGARVILTARQII